MLLSFCVICEMVLSIFPFRLKFTCVSRIIEVVILRFLNFTLYCDNTTVHRDCDTLPFNFYYLVDY